VVVVELEDVDERVVPILVVLLWGEPLSKLRPTADPIAITIIRITAAVIAPLDAINLETQSEPYGCKLNFF
jgi:hypothetical protein